MPRARRQTDPLQSAEGALLYGDLLRATAHELGTIAGALSFLAMLQAPERAQGDASTLAGLAHDLRDVMGAVRLAHEPVRAPPMMRDTHAAMSTWWQTCSRFMSASLPRQVELRTQFDIDAMAVDEGRAAAFLLWTACRLLSTQADVPPPAVTVHVARTTVDVETLVVVLSTSHPLVLHPEPRRWSLFRARLCRVYGAQCAGWEAAPNGCHWTIRRPIDGATDR